MILLTQSTAVLHKKMNDERKLLCLLQFFPEGCTEFPEFSTFREIPKHSRLVASLKKTAAKDTS